VNTTALTYAVVTPARNEAQNLPRLAASMVNQTVLPLAWVIVDHGSTDETAMVAARLASVHDWISVVSIEGEATPTRGGPIVQAFNVGLGMLGNPADVVVKLDADVSFEPDHFALLLDEFVRDPALGIGSSTCWEHGRGVWRPKAVARSHVRGAVRAYRWRCLQEVMPLEPRMGWDTIDEIKARLNGWSTRSVPEVAFFHYRPLGTASASEKATVAVTIRSAGRASASRTTAHSGTTPLTSSSSPACSSMKSTTLRTVYSPPAP